MSAAETIMQSINGLKQFNAVRMLDGASLAVRKREAEVILGPSGSGKTTLRRCIIFSPPWVKGTRQFLPHNFVH